MAAFVSEISTARRSAWTLPILSYVLFAAACIALLHPTALQMAMTWLQSSSHHHGLVVAPLALWMILSRPRIAPSTHALSLIGVFLASILWLAGRAAGAAIVEQMAFVSLLIAGAGVIFGAEALKRWAAPLLFLFFMVPVGAVLVPYLQQATAHTVVALLSVTGMDVGIDGIFIETPAGLFEIAEACAGLNFLLAAMMIAGFYACQFLRTNKTRAAFFIIAGIIALAANFIRVFLLILIATITQMRVAVGPDHFVIGLVFYAVVLVILISIGEKMRGRERAIADRAPSMTIRPWRPVTAAAALAPLAAASIYAVCVVNSSDQPAAPSEISPFSAAGWRILPGPDNWRPPLSADRVTTQTYESGAGRVYTATAYFTHDRQGAEIVTYQNRAWDSEHWRRIGRAEQMVYLFGKAQMTPLDLIAGAEGRRLAAITAYWRGDEVFLDRNKMKLAQMLGKLRGENPPGGVIILTAAYRSDPAEAMDVIRPFTHQLEEFSAWRARNGGAE
ncbi:exosortase A [Hyphococcus sp.]|uniref:exosortase A n=1 Tax=Hyphococcus sp. TaxID=2038636 RepID=UPI003CCBD36C